MFKLTIQEYVALVVKSGLLADGNVKREHIAFLATLGDGQHERERDPQAFADYLESQGLLTKWQNSHLFKGRYRGLILGKFRVLKLIGAGGMGRVFLAENQRLKRQVALKILPAKRKKNATSLQRFHREAQALAKLSHDNIIRVYDIDEIDDTHLIVMEYVPGVDLQRKVQRDGALDGPTAADYTRQVASGLAHAHSAGLIHRDIKPANMLLGADGVVKILDLGLALFQQDEDGSITADPNRALGTADYISPEQALSSRELDIRTDIYSLGCTLYFFLTGRAPFAEGTNAQRLLAHQIQIARPINEVRRERDLAPVSAGLNATCVRMMAKSPDERFASAEEVVAVLADLVSQANVHLATAVSNPPSHHGGPIKAIPVASGVQPSVSHTQSINRNPAARLGIAVQASQLQIDTKSSQQQIGTHSSAYDSSDRNVSLSHITPVRRTLATRRRKSRYLTGWLISGGLVSSLCGLIWFLSQQPMGDVQSEPSKSYPATEQTSESVSHRPTIQNNAPDHAEGPDAASSNAASSNATGPNTDISDAANLETPLSDLFYVIGDNTTYHREDCQHVSRRSNLRAVTRASIERVGLRACRTCRPD